MSVSSGSGSQLIVQDLEIQDGDFFGTVSSKGSHVWLLEDGIARRVGIPNPDYRSKTTPRPDQSLKEALRALPMFDGVQFSIHKMILTPGAFYHRMARPSDQHPKEAPGSLPNLSSVRDELVSTLNQTRSLVGMLDQIFQAIHPVDCNMACFGNSIRNLLILACTECEAQWRGVLRANGVRAEKLTTEDYVRLLPACRLDEYVVRLQHYPWSSGIAPFGQWSAEQPTQSLFWYDAYNAAKHDREEAFHRATLQAAVSAVAAVWVMIACQYGHSGMREFNDLFRYFTLEQVPEWDFSEIYTLRCDEFAAEAGPRTFPM